jgi:hypothetical protein
VIRPSSLSIARFCMLAPALSELWPSRNDAADRGNAVDGQFTGELRDGVVATDADARACIGWVAEHLAGHEVMPQQRVRLLDPDTGGLLTEGTADLVAVRGDGPVVIVDLKKREQMLAGRLTEVDSNLQLHSYGLAEMLRLGHGAYQLCLLLFGDGEVEAQWSEIYTVHSWMPVLEEIRAIQDRQEANPKPTSGPHCLACYPRVHCPSWTLPAHQGPTELEPFTKPGGLTRENFGRALAAREALKDVVELVGEQLKAFADANGGKVPVGGGKAWGSVMSKGKASIDAKKLEADGLLEKYTRRGAPFPTYRLTNDRAAK